MLSSSKIFYMALLCFVISATGLFAQSTQLTITPQNPTYCAPGTATMTANLPTAFTGTSVTLPDDGYTGIINIGFPFTFFGTAYTQCLISSNNYITFNTAGAGGYSPWFIPAAIPTVSDPTNSIMCPWQDLLPPSGGTITYATLGTAPNRVFVVAYCSVAMFSCTTLHFTSQIQLHETSNFIETHIASKPLCAAWNGGNAIHGIQNNAGTIAYVVPGRNWPTQWTTTLEGYRWTPTGPNTYTQGLIPYAPVILSATTGPIQWFIGATLVGTGPTLTVSPTTTTTYTATVTGGCIGTSSATDTVHVVTISCEAGNNVTACSGSAVALTGSTTSTNTPTYTWTPAATLNNGNLQNPTAHPVATTAYILTVHDASGCAASDTVNVTIMAITASAGVQDTVCPGGSTVLHGTTTSIAAPFTWVWTPNATLTGANTQNPTATPAVTTTYTLTVTDANGCTATSTVTIVVAPPITLTMSSVPVLCNGGATGSASVAVAGGYPTLTYSWSPGVGSATSTYSSLAAGTYTVTVTDRRGCTKTATVVVTQPTVLTSTQASTNVTCNAACNGTASVTVTGGTPGYTYTWTPAPGTGQGTPSASNMCAGTYSCLIHDLNGCTITDVFNITEPTALTASITASTNVNCFGQNNGSATCTPGGGSPLYTYSWNSAPVQTTQTAVNLTAGTYVCTVTDNHGCTITATVIISQPAALTATSTFTNVTCNGVPNGTGTANPAGGSPLYTYSWNSIPAQTTQIATGLAAGTYTCTITDAHGCTTTVTITLTQPPALTATATPTGSTCGNPNGQIVCNPAGGSPLYTYSWNTAPVQTTQTATGLFSGTYTCTVTDSHGCTFNVSANVSNSGGPTVSMGAIVNVSCNGLCNGSATVIATGGTGLLTYSWSTTPSQNTITATALCPGTYTATVNDANGCTQTATATITEPPLLTASITASTNVSCSGGNNGSATAAGAGGTPLYTYSWNTIPAQTTATATALAIGTYTCTVNDNHGCTATTTVTITQPAPLAVTNSQTNVSCNGGTDGTATVTVTGGTLNYTYSWNTAPSQSTLNATGLSFGTYTCTITDFHGCVITSVVNITQPPALVLSLTQVSAHCNQSDGRATVTVTGGTGVPTYTWSPAPSISGQGTPNANGFTPGTVTVTVHDANNCVAAGTILIQNVPGVTVTIPTSTNVNCFSGNNGSATAVPASGTAPYTYSWSGNPSVTATANSLVMGTYTCTVTDSAGCINTATVTITQPPLLVVSPMAHVTICLSNCTPLTATSTGGTPGYTYSWTTSAGPVATPTSVCPTTTTNYTVYCTDSHGCISATATTQVIVNPSLEVTAGGTASVCPGGSTPLTANGSGGGGVYSYLWQPPAGLSSPTAQNPTATPAATTTYTVILSDNCGSPTDSATVTVTVYAPPVITLTASDSAGCNPHAITFNCSSVAPCASAAWQFGDGGLATGCGSQTHTYTTAGSYAVTVHVTDIHGCPGTLTKPAWITIYPVPEAAFTGGPQPATILNSTMVFVNQSTGAATYNWNFGDIANASSTLAAPSYMYPDTGTFMVTLVAKNTFGCTDTATGPIIIKPDYTFFAPNAFTPNGDGLNDVWMPKGVGVEPAQYKIYIFDRWGNLIWTSSTWGEGWDGRANNGSDIAQNDTYVWKVYLTNYQGTKLSYTGMINLLK